MRTRQRGDGPEKARGHELERLKRTTSSGFYCGRCGTRERGKHRKWMHMAKDQVCASSFSFPAKCKAIIPGLTPYGAKCVKCDPKGSTRKWKQPEDKPLP